jgi:hypothetical protein
MARKRSWLVATGVALVGVLSVGAGPAGAVIPTGNLLANSGTESSSASSTGNDVFTLDPWVPNTMASPRATAVRYGAPGFPTVAQGQALDGGRSFFAGGPTAANDDDTLPYKYALLDQTVAVPATAEEDIDAGTVQFTVSGCLGGYSNQDDQATVAGVGLTSGGSPTSSNVVLYGPDAAGRGNQTELLGQTGTLAAGAGTRKFAVQLEFNRLSGKGSYNDAYADNIGLRLSPNGSPPPDADCSPAGGSSGGGGGGKQTGPAGSNTAVGITRVGKNLTFEGRYALVKLRCTLHDTNCKGALGLATIGLPRAKATIARKAKATKLGSAKFTIAKGKTKTIKVKLKRSIRRRLGALSKRRLKKLKITATAKTGAGTTKFTLGAVRKR